VAVLTVDLSTSLHNCLSLPLDGRIFCFITAYLMISFPTTNHRTHGSLLTMHQTVGQTD